MEAVKLNDEQAKVVREFTEYANELYEKYKKLAKDLRVIEYLTEDYNTLLDNLWLVVCQLEGIKNLKVNAENVLYNGGKQTDKAHFIDEFLYWLYEIKGYSVLIDPYLTIDINHDVWELCFKMHTIIVSIITD